MCNLDPFRPLIGAKTIAEYMMYGYTHWLRIIAPKMQKYGCADKRKLKSRVTWFSTPYLINMYWSMCADMEPQHFWKGKNKRKRKVKKAKKT